MDAVSFPKRRGGSALLAVCAILAMLQGCGRVSTADFSGYVKDRATTQGIVGATISVYLSDPGTVPGSATPFTATTTGYNSQIPGYYSHKLIWSNLWPAFQDQGDLATVWVVASHPDYGSSAATKVSGIVSGSQNTAPDVLLTRTGFSAIVSGTVLYTPTLTGVNNVAVAIQLDATAAVEADDYRTVTTGSVTGATTTLGVFSFSVPVRWTNAAAATGGADVKSVKVWLTWPALTVPAAIAAGSKSYTVDIASGTAPNIIGPFFIP